MRPSRWWPGVGFSAGDGVDANIFFDLDIAMALERRPGAGPPAAALARRCWRWPMPRRWRCSWRAISMTTISPIPKASRAGAAGYRLSLPSCRPGAVRKSVALLLGGQRRPSRCLQSVRAVQDRRAQRCRCWPRLMRARYFARRSVGLRWTPFRAGRQGARRPGAHYRVDHIDDNGVFLVPQ